MNNALDLIGVGAADPYIEEYYVYQSIHYDKINDNTIIIGDFNSNHIWNTAQRERYHIAVVNELKKKQKLHSICIVIWIRHIKSITAL